MHHLRLEHHRERHASMKKKDRDHPITAACDDNDNNNMCIILTTLPSDIYKLLSSSQLASTAIRLAADSSSRQRASTVV